MSAAVFLSLFIKIKESAAAYGGKRLSCTGGQRESAERSRVPTGTPSGNTSPRLTPLLTPSQVPVCVRERERCVCNLSGQANNFAQITFFFCPADCKGLCSGSVSVGGWGVGGLGVLGFVRPADRARRLVSVRRSNGSESVWEIKHRPEHVVVFIGKEQSLRGSVPLCLHAGVPAGSGTLPATNHARVSNYWGKPHTIKGGVRVTPRVSAAFDDVANDTEREIHLSDKRNSVPKCD